jgi:transcriptional regulator with XRE-family HTH domain
MRALDQRLAGASLTDTYHGRLLAARQHSRLTEAEAAGLGQLTVKKLQSMERGGESGRAPAAATLARLAAAYGVSAVWLAAGSASGAHLVPDWYVPAHGAAAGGTP